MTTTAPTSTMSDQEKMDLVDRHAAAELVLDWDATWDTLDPEDSYDYFPLGLRISGREAMQEHWHRLFSHPALKDLPDTTMKRWCRDEDVVLIALAPVTLPGGQRRLSTNSATYTFRGDKIYRESVFADDLIAALLEEVFDEEFRSLPGVSVIETF